MADQEDNSYGTREIREEQMDDEEEGSSPSPPKKNPLNLELCLPKKEEESSVEKEALQTPGTAGSLQMPSGATPSTSSAPAASFSRQESVASSIGEGDSFLGDAEPTSKEKTKEELEVEEREKMQVLVSNFTEEQLDRYEFYRRVAFPRIAIKRIMATITGGSIGQNVVISMSGIAKVFAGEVIETALDYAEEIGDKGSPLEPRHLREAVRRLRESERLPMPRSRKRCPFK